MKCTSKKFNKRINSFRKSMAALCIGLVIVGGLSGCANTPKKEVTLYEQSQYDKSLYQGTLFASDLCVTSADVGLEGITNNESLHAAGLFDLSNDKVLYAFRIHDRLYPASTTKILTAYVALKYGNLEDVVTVSENAVNFDWDSQLCGLAAGDSLTLYDLLCGLMLWSGNDAAVAIAEHLSGSTEAFCQIMNQEAQNMGATNTNFTSPHGLHDANHYTTAYDLYLIFNECIKDQRFLDLIALSGHTAAITGADGTIREKEWVPTNFYSAGEAEMPKDVQVIGGKTGTTDEAGNCLILYSEDLEENPYISVVMGAPDKPLLYEEMSRMLSLGAASNQQ